MVPVTDMIGGIEVAGNHGQRNVSLWDVASACLSIATVAFTSLSTGLDGPSRFIHNV
jgi:hypothetical protein